MRQIVVPSIVPLHLRHKEHLPIAPTAQCAHALFARKVEHIGAVVDGRGGFIG